MKQRSKKGFSLIELIVVIAVIAAIAAVIVPQFTNISGAAKNAADQRNVQLWNEVYANAYAISGGAGGTAPTNGTLPTNVNAVAGGSVPNIDVSFTLSGAVMNFNAPGFNMEGNKNYTFNVGGGIK